MTGTSVATLNAELTPEIRNTVKNYMDQTFENILRKVGQTVRLNCGHPLTDTVLSELVGSVLAWTFNNEPLIMDPSRMFFYKGNLDVADLIPSDTGVYECVVKWGSGSMFENISVGVYSLQVTSDTPTRYVFENDPLTLVCHSQTLGRLFPASSRRWLLNQTAVTSLAATLAENKTNELVPRVGRKQAGVWECQVIHSRTNRTWDTAWLQIGVDDPPSFAAKWYRVMADNKALVFMIIGLVIVISFVIFLYSAIRLKKTEDDSEKEFIKERKGWQETLNNFVEKGEVTAADFPDPETDDESSLQDEGDDTTDTDDGQETSEGGEATVENTDEEIAENELEKNETEVPDKSEEDAGVEEEAGNEHQTEANEIQPLMTGEIDQKESDDADLTETDENEMVTATEVDQWDSDDAFLEDAERNDHVTSGDVDQSETDDFNLDDLVMGEATDESGVVDETQNAHQTNTNAWHKSTGRSSRRKVGQNLIEDVDECRTRVFSKEKLSGRQTTNDKKKQPKEKFRVELNKEMAFKWLFKHSPHLKKLDSIMKETSDVSLIDLDFSPSLHPGLIPPSGSVKPHATVTGNRAQHKMCGVDEVLKTSQRFPLQTKSKAEHQKNAVKPGEYFSPECSKVMTDWRRRLENSAKSRQEHASSHPLRHSPWLPRFVERWKHTTRRKDATGRRAKYTALTQDDYV